MIRRLMGSEIEERPDATVVRTPSNPTFHWGNYLVLPAPPAAVDARRLVQLWDAEFPNASHRAIGVDGPSGNVGHPTVAAALGAVPELSPVLTATAVPEAGPVADGSGVEIRALDPGDDTGWEQLFALRADSGDLEADSEDYVRGRIAESRRAVDRGYGAWWAAFVNGRARAELGIFSDGCGIARYQHVGTHPGFRRRRLASALLAAAGGWALECLPGVTTLVIIAEPEGPAAGAYRRLGFTDQEWSAQLYRKPDPG